MKHLKKFNESQSIKLKTLTMKSKIGSGKYPDYTIEKMLEYDNLRNYLAYSYFNYDKINFTDDVLKRIFGDNLELFKINKPGKNPELNSEYLKLKFKQNVKYVEIGDTDLNDENDEKEISSPEKISSDLKKNQSLQSYINDKNKHISKKYLKFIDTILKLYNLNLEEVLKMYDQKKKKFESDSELKLVDEKIMLNCVITQWLKEVKKIDTESVYVKTINAFVSNMDNSKSEWAIICFSNMYNNKQIKLKPFSSKDIAYVTFDINNDKKPLNFRGIISKEDFNKYSTFSSFHEKAILIQKDYIRH